MQGYLRAAALLPASVREIFLKLQEDDLLRAEELRLRMGKLPTVLISREERSIPGSFPVDSEMLSRVLELATGASPYAAAEAVRQGYITASGGVRVGLCGIVRPGSGGDWALSGLSSAAIRIPREIRGCADRFCRSPFVSTLIVSPPGAGKTTLLRDLVRQLSDGGIRVGLCDEREEVAAFSADGPGFDVGRHTDVLSQLPRARAAMQLIRTMNPQIIAMDEISATEDRAACQAVFGCGVKLLATAHGESREDLCRRPGWTWLLGEGLFSRVLLIHVHRGRREYREEWL